jgi:cytochrome P450
VNAYKTIPVPKALPWVGSLAELTASPTRFFRELASKYGDIAAFNLPGEQPIVLSHPEYIEQMMLTQHRKFIKSEDYRKGLDVVGNGLLTSEGDFWLRQRRLAQPAFHKNRIAAYAETITEFTYRWASRHKAGQQVDFHHEMMLLTLEIVAKCLFDTDARQITQTVSTALEVVLQTFDVRRQNPLYRMVPANFPLPQNLKNRRAIAELHKVVDDVILNTSAEGNSLLAMLKQAKDEDGSQMTHQQLRDEVLTLLLAGHETTANLMSWTFYLLDQHPEVAGALGAQVQEVLGGRPATIEDIPKLVGADQVIKESLRMYPPAWGVSRHSLEDCQVGEYLIPANRRVVALAWVTHNDPRWFEQPQAFRPERWAEGLEKQLPRFAYWPFGGGPRLCIGQSFAQMEAVLILVGLLQHFRFPVQQGFVPQIHASATLRLGNGLPVSLLAP